MSINSLLSYKCLRLLYYVLESQRNCESFKLLKQKFGLIRHNSTSNHVFPIEMQTSLGKTPRSFTTSKVCVGLQDRSTVIGLACSYLANGIVRHGYKSGNK